jgi:hypothetical protein
VFERLAVDTNSHLNLTVRKTDLPFQLGAGIYIENIQTLVPWGTEMNKLPEFGSAEVTRKQNGLWIDWRDCRCLGGVLCNMGACQLKEEVSPTAYHVFLPEFHWANLTLIPVRELTTSLLRRTFRHLEKNLGMPHYVYAEYYAGLPTIWWEFENVKVSIGPKYGCESASVTISHDPTGFAALKQRAAEWETQHGVGARQDYKKGIGF